MTKTAIAPSIKPGDDRAAAEDRHPVVDDAGVVERAEPTVAGARCPAAPSAPSIWPCAHEAMFGSIASTIAGACRAGVVWNAWAPMTRPMNSRIGTSASIGMTARNRPTSPRRQIDRDDDAGRERVADPAADGLPAGMADVDGRRERAAEERADDGADAVREQDVAQVVVVAGGRRALDVVHPLGEVVDAERDRRDEQRQDARTGR